MATSKINNILDKLDAGNIAEIVGNPNEMARSRYRLSSNTVEDHPEFYAIIVDYYRHHYAETICDGVHVPEEMVASEVRDILQHAYREHGGYEGAYNCARTGEAGGMNAVLNAMARVMRERQEQSYVDHIFFSEVDPMNYEEIVQLMEQYLARFSSYLSPEDRARSPHDLARNYDMVLRSHAHAMSAVRGLIRHY